MLTCFSVLKMGPGSFSGLADARETLELRFSRANRSRRSLPGAGRAGPGLPRPSWERSGSCRVVLCANFYQNEAAQGNPRLSPLRDRRSAREPGVPWRLAPLASQGAAGKGFALLVPRSTFLPCILCAGYSGCIFFHLNARDMETLCSRLEVSIASHSVGAGCCCV